MAEEAETSLTHQGLVLDAFQLEDIQLALWLWTLKDFFTCSKFSFYKRVVGWLSLGDT